MKTCKGKEDFIKQPCSLRSSTWVGNGQSCGVTPFCGGRFLHFKPSAKDTLLCHGWIPMRPLRYPASDSFGVGTLEVSGTRQTLLWFGLARDRCGEERDWFQVSVILLSVAPTPLQNTNPSLVCPKEGFVYSTMDKKYFDHSCAPETILGSANTVIN